MSSNGVPAASPASPPGSSPPGRPLGVVILLMGHTGAGKSHFINKAAGGEVAPVNHSITTKHFDIQCHNVVNPNVVDPRNPASRVTLVEIPGFNNPSKQHSDVEIIRRVRSWLEKDCDDDVLFGGIVVLHDIAEDEATMYTNTQPWPVKYLNSPDLLQRLILTTGKWGQTLVKEDMGKYVKRAQALSELPAWKGLLDRGASAGRYDGNPHSAWNVINPLLGMNPLGVREMRKQFRTVQETLLAKPLPKPPRGLVRLIKTFFERASDFDFLGSTTRHTVVIPGSGGSLEILSRSSKFRVETVTVVSPRGDYIVHNSYHFSGPVALIGAGAVAAEFLREQATRP